jgi:RNA polymerase sigma-70 factor (ECF subfamily)
MADLDELAAAAQRGDRAALAAFVRATQDDVWRFCAYLAGWAAADDLAQDAYLRAFRALPGWRHDAPAKVWLLAIARRTVADHHRRRQRGRRVPLAPAGPVPAVADPAGHIALRDLVAGLDPDRRTAFVLTQVVGLRYEEAAAVCGCPVGTIRSRVARARDDLIRAEDEAATA